MSKKYTYIEVKNIIEKEYNVERLYLISEQYNGYLNEIVIMNNDGYLLKTNLGSVVNSKRRNGSLNFFSNKNKFIVKNIKRWLRKNTDNYTLLSKTYITIHKKLDFKCGNNHIFSLDFHHLKNHGNRCQHCSKKYKRTTKDYIDDVSNKFENKYTILGEFERIHKHIKTKCNTCESIWEVTPANLLRGYGCPNCAIQEQINNQTKTNEQFLKEVYDSVGNEFTFLEEYIKNYIKIRVKHNKCGHEWKVAPTRFLHGTRCPNCNVSKGEKRIREWLVDNNISFEEQLKFANCKHKRHLLFDFVLYDNNEILMVIEFDGKQHYTPIEYFGGEKSFKTSKERDKIKNNFCKINNIKLLRIPYWDFDRIEEILINNILNTYTKAKNNDIIIHKVN